MSTDPLTRCNEILAAPVRAAQYRPPWLLIILQGILSGVVLCQVLVDPKPPVSGLFEVVVPLVLLLPIAYAVKYINRSDQAATHQSRILLTTLLFVVIHTGVAFIIHLSIPADNTRIVELLFPVVTGATSGAGLGSLVGVNYSQFQKMQAKLETEVERGRRLNQRLTVINRVLRHNVRNKLTLVFGRIDRVTEEIEDPSNVSRLQQTRRALEDLHSSTESALQVEHLRERRAETVLSDLGPILTTVCEGVREETPAATIDVSIPSKVRIRAHSLLPVAIEEILENAVKHNNAEDLSVNVTVNVEDEQVIITVTDDGCGISEAEIEALYIDEEKPLQRTNGVGLWVFKWVTEASDGDWKICSTGDGTAVTLQIPRE